MGITSNLIIATVKHSPKMNKIPNQCFLFLIRIIFFSINSSSTGTMTKNDIQREKQINTDKLDSKRERERKKRKSTKPNQTGGKKTKNNNNKK